MCQHCTGWLGGGGGGREVRARKTAVFNHRLSSSVMFSSSVEIVPVLS